MHALLVAGNILLAVLAGWSVISAVTPDGSGKKNTYQVKRQSQRGKGQENRKTASAPSVLDEVAKEDSAKRVTRIVDGDIFNPERSPNAGVRGRNARLEMALAGTFEIGEIKGAIILQRAMQRPQQNMFLLQLMAAGGMRPNFGGGGGGGGFVPANGPPGGGNRFLGGGRLRGGNDGGRGGRGGFGERRGFMRERFGANPREAAQTGIIRQYVRLGDTLANGYTLTAVERTRVTLVRGGDKMELELQEPTKNMRNASRGRGGRQMSVQQQRDQASMFVQMQMMRTMQQMVRNNNSGRGGGGGRGRR